MALLAGIGASLFREAARVTSAAVETAEGDAANALFDTEDRARQRAEQRLFGPKQAQTIRHPVRVVPDVQTVQLRSAPAPVSTRQLMTEARMAAPTHQRTDAHAHAGEAPAQQPTGNKSGDHAHVQALSDAVNAAASQEGGDGVVELTHADMNAWLDVARRCVSTAGKIRRHADAVLREHATHGSPSRRHGSSVRHTGGGMGHAQHSEALAHMSPEEIEAERAEAEAARKAADRLVGFIGEAMVHIETGQVSPQELAMLHASDQQLQRISGRASEWLKRKKKQFKKWTKKKKKQYKKWKKRRAKKKRRAAKRRDSLDADSMSASFDSDDDDEDMDGRVGNRAAHGAAPASSVNMAARLAPTRLPRAPSARKPVAHEPTRQHKQHEQHQPVHSNPYPAPTFTEPARRFVPTFD